MWQFPKTVFLLFLTVFLIESSWASDGQYSGWVNLQSRFYPQTGERVDEQFYTGGAVQLNYTHDITDDDQLVATL
ncbi:MAG: hypothetical protein MI808_05980, partial [Pseudomonadales bacterium]|nr:hypothetical protein [Pseudomonadales bacterium]